MTLARVFPRKTNGTPVDPYAFVGYPPLECFIPEDITEIHVSVTFSWDLPEAERMAYAWQAKKIAPVTLGGPVFEKAADNKKACEFEPGKYLRKGYTITSRGCPNRCWFCEVPNREGLLQELEIKPGSNVLDNNLLACSEQHIRRVFKMLESQKDAILSGGLEAKRLKAWHVELFAKAHIKEAFFAYDTPDDLPALEAAAVLLKQNEWYRDYKCRCYVLCGYKGDSLEAADSRCKALLELGYYPFAMYYRDPADERPRILKPRCWQDLCCTWTRPACINATKKKYLNRGKAA